VEDHPMRQHRPVAPFEQRPDGVLDLDRVGFGGQLPAVHQPLKMGVDGYPGHVEGVAEDDVGGLAADPGQAHQVVQPAGHLAVVPLDELSTKVDQRVRLVPEEPGGPDHLLQRGPVRSGVVGGGRVPEEQLGSHLVDPLVGALRGEDGGHGQLQRPGVVELAVGVGVRLGEQPPDPPGPPLPTKIRFDGTPGRPRGPNRPGRRTGRRSGSGADGIACRTHAGQPTSRP
jgi:hypothetical protein